jgi:hypothetical protein
VSLWLRTQAGSQQTKEQAKEYARLEAALTSAPGERYGPEDDDNIHGLDNENENADNLDSIDMEMSDEDSGPVVQEAPAAAMPSAQRMLVGWHGGLWASQSRAFASRRLRLVGCSVPLMY